MGVVNCGDTEKRLFVCKNISRWLTLKNRSRFIPVKVMVCSIDAYKEKAFVTICICGRGMETKIDMCEVR